MRLGPIFGLALAAAIATSVLPISSSHAETYSGVLKTGRRSPVSRMSLIPTECGIAVPSAVLRPGPLRRPDAVGWDTVGWDTGGWVTVGGDTAGAATAGAGTADSIVIGFRFCGSVGPAEPPGALTP